MSNDFYDFLLFLSALILAGLAFVNELPDNKFGILLKKLSIKFVIIIFAVLVGIYGTRGKESNAQKETTDAEKRRDDENRKFTEQSNAKLKLQLAAYGYTLDAQKNEIIRFVRDSAKHTNINVTKSDIPELDIIQIGLKEKKRDTVRFVLNLLCKKAKANHVYLRFYVCTDDLAKPFELIPDKGTKAVNNISLISDASDAIIYTIDGYFANNANNFYFLLLGSFMDNKDKNYPIKILSEFNVKTNFFETPISPLDNQLYNFYHGQGIAFN